MTVMAAEAAVAVEVLVDGLFDAVHCTSSVEAEAKGSAV